MKDASVVKDINHIEDLMDFKDIKKYIESKALWISWILFNHQGCLGC